MLNLSGFSTSTQTEIHIESFPSDLKGFNVEFLNQVFITSHEGPHKLLSIC